VGGSLVFIVLVVGAVLVFSALTKGGTPEAAAATAVATATAIPDPTEEPGVAAPDPTATTTPEPTSSPTATATQDNAGETTNPDQAEPTVEVDVSPDSPKVGDPLLIIAVLVYAGDTEIRDIEFDVIGEVNPQLTLQNPPLIEDWLGDLSSAKRPAILRFQAEEAGAVELQIKATYTMNDAARETLSEIVLVEIQN
jgi:hypothetical protein